MDNILKSLGIHEFYLDTVSTRKLSKMLAFGNHQDILISIHTIIELIANIKNEESFSRNRTILDNLSKGNFTLDPHLPIQIFKKAFNNSISTNVGNQIVEMAKRIIDFNSYQDWLEHEISQEPHPNIYEYVQISDDSQPFIQLLKKKIPAGSAKKNIEEFNNRWDKNENREENFMRIIDYYTNINRQECPDKADKIHYNGSIDLFLLVHAYYVDMKIAHHDNAGRNDFQDLLHLLYIRDGVTFVTDDRHLRENVNSLWKERAITTDEFLKRYNI